MVTRETPSKVDEYRQGILERRWLDVFMALQDKLETGRKSIAVIRRPLQGSPQCESHKSEYVNVIG